MAIPYVKRGMVEALRYIMPDGVVENIDAFIRRRPEIEWEVVYGSTTIYATQHFITYGGGPEGGMFIFTGSVRRDGVGGSAAGAPPQPTRSSEDC